ncbi:hypothetical protein STPYR_11849 [uncultured Stenotrophomonas sp.]|uniref:Uncharacterized protein n=1 Tax=uncultured Stenotrophomonas sp. TaxID=165438 RepID=A0A1Y5Q3R2_9GAMM|nr:hypothetical protein STPYR_11849 [uncultured Stenotrophomonas sp.]
MAGLLSFVCTVLLPLPLPVRMQKATRKRPDLSIGPFVFGCPGWIRTTECLSQSQVPYRLATGQYTRRLSHSLRVDANVCIRGGYGWTRTTDPSIMSAVL